MASVSGPTSLTVNFSGAGSFDYDGTIASYSWDFSDPACTTGCTSTSATPSFTYSADGSYWARLTVVDSDGNSHESGVSVDVSAVAKVKTVNKKKMKLDSEHDSERERMRRQYIRACAINRHGRSCYEAGKMYQEDGNNVVAGNYFQKACAYGYEAACSWK